MGRLSARRLISSAERARGEKMTPSMTCERIPSSTTRSASARPPVTSSSTMKPSAAASSLMRAASSAK